MERFESMFKAAEAAAARCIGWSFADSDEMYDREGLLVIAQVHDEENPADEGDFYLISPGGAIGFCEEGDEIDWLFLPYPGLAEDLPRSYTPAPQGRFCTDCGTKLHPGASFCGGCGRAL